MGVEGISVVNKALIFNRLNPEDQERISSSSNSQEVITFEGSDYTLYDLRGIINENQREYGESPMSFGSGFNNNYEHYPPLKPIPSTIKKIELDPDLNRGAVIKSVSKSKQFLKDPASFEGGEEPKEEFDALAAFKRTILDQTKDYPPPPPLMYFVQHGEKFPHRTKKSFSLQQGKQKSKKTTGLAIEVAAYINPKTCSDALYFECVEPGAVLFFDCEQGQSYAARTMKLILKMAGVDTHPNLIYCDTRELNPKERLLTIAAAIADTKNVKWVIIDGLVDVMNDFMSAEEAHLLMTYLLKLCSEFDIHITGVLHQNKGISKDARAHIGSIAGQKCEVEIMVERDSENKELSVVSAKESRGLPFEDFAIRWEKGGLPYIVQDWYQATTTTTGRQISRTPYDTDHEVHLKLLKSSFNNNPEKMRRSELFPAIASAVSSYQELKQPIGRDKAALWAAYWIENGYLDHEGTSGTKSSRYFIKYDSFK